jgi:hypothetical protein
MWPRRDLKAIKVAQSAAPSVDIEYQRIIRSETPLDYDPTPRHALHQYISPRQLT